MLNNINYIKIFIQIIIAFIIYSFFFCSLGNTCYRIDSLGIKRIQILPLLTEGIFGHFRSLYLTLFHNSIKSFFIYLYDLFFSLHNIFGALIFVFYISILIKKNL
jgi:hypothetical protein